MKIPCPCGALVIDQTDALPHKGHLIADQQWLPVFDGIDLVIAEVATGRMNVEAASMKIRGILGARSRLIHQCKQCGRLFVHDRNHQVHTFAPAPAEVCKEILRSTDSDIEVQ